jgi:uncharacterized repeat protein (TIGR04138 family)|tara:strand:+ start:138 stop:548 length:411 start_codon:yes stop_codon:yes gene_type:complete
MTDKSDEAQVEALAEIDGRYNKEAYAFVYKSLHYTVQKLGKRQLPQAQRHISGADLLKGLSELALDEFGPLTISVFAHWGVYKTEDFGHIVFNLVNEGLMGKTEQDKIEDFTDVYDFAVEFDWRRRRKNVRRKRTK